MFFRSNFFIIMDSGEKELSGRIFDRYKFSEVALLNVFGRCAEAFS